MILHLEKRGMRVRFPERHLRIADLNICENILTRF